MKRLSSPETPHPNIVQFVDFVDQQYLVMELCSGGDLRSVIGRNRTVEMDHCVAFRVLLHCCEGLRRIHELGLLHRDVKPENILLSCPDPSVATFKLADMGFLRCERECQRIEPDDSKRCGTPLYWAPEIAGVRRSHWKGSDIWAAGCCCYEVWAGRRVHSVGRGRASSRGSKITDSERHELIKQSIHCGSIGGDDSHAMLRFLVGTCCQADPRMRTTMPNLLTVLRGMTQQTNKQTTVWNCCIFN